MTALPKNSWRDKEPSLEEMRAKHPDFPPALILKIDAQRRGVVYTERALRHVDPQIHMTCVRSDYYDKEDLTPVSLILPCGTSIFTEGFLSEHNGREPYLVDHDENEAFISDNGERLSSVDFWEKPDYYDKITTSGKPMWQIVSARPQRLTIHPNQYCDFWKNKGEGCKFCVMAANYVAGKKDALLPICDIVETVTEAVKEPGRNQSIFLTGGSIITGNNEFDDELDMYLKILKGLGPIFNQKKIPSQLISTAFSREQLKRLHGETFLTSYTADIEVLNKDLFNWICVGKARVIGYDGWKERLLDAVEIFGQGNVNTGIVSGVEMASPNGFNSEEEALESTLSEAENLLANGVFVVACVFRVLKGSIFHRQKTPSLDYYVRLTKGLNSLRQKYGLSPDMDNYRRCGNHADTDLARI
jgi:hypothetical protein